MSYFYRCTLCLQVFDIQNKEENKELFQHFDWRKRNQTIDTKKYIFCILKIPSNITILKAFKLRPSNIFCGKLAGVLTNGDTKIPFAVPVFSEKESYGKNKKTVTRRVRNKNARWKH